MVGVFVAFIRVVYGRTIYMSLPVPLSSIDTETVAEALVSIFSRVGIPSEILTNMGTQFTSSVMKEVSRLLSVKQLSGASQFCADSITDMTPEWSSGQVMNGLISIPLRSSTHENSNVSVGQSFSDRNEMFMKMRQLADGRPEVRTCANVNDFSSSVKGD